MSSSHAAVRAKLLAKRTTLPQADDVDNILRYIFNRNEKAVIRTIVKGFELADINHYLTLWRCVKGLAKVDSLAMTNVIGTEVDLQNIVWMYRLKRFYNISGDATYGFLIPVQHRLPKETLDTLVTIKSADAMQAVLDKTIYHNVFGDFSHAEKKLRTAVTAKYKKESRNSHIALICGFLYERQHV